MKQFPRFVESPHALASLALALVSIVILCIPFVGYASLGVYGLIDCLRKDASKATNSAIAIVACLFAMFLVLLPFIRGGQR